MRFNPKARLDRSQVQTRRGGGSGGGTRMPIPSGMGGKVGGGIGGIILLVIIVVIQTQMGGGDSGGGSEETGTLDSCSSGADANEDERCALLADVNSIQAFWEKALPDQTGTKYVDADAVLFEGQTTTACGPASSDVGPFYCPADQLVYLDSTFFDDMLEGQLGARGGPFSEAYVLAHEYGHHLQDLLGTMDRVDPGKGETSDSVRLELQADCYAGIWTKYATTGADEDGDVFIEDLTDDDIARALDAARAVGDDRIQERSGGRVDPDQWTHGSAESRMRWFTVGQEKGSIDACDTFSASRL